VRPKWFLCLCYIWCKPSTNLASREALSRNGPNRASTWASSHRSLIEIVQYDFYAYGCWVQTVLQPCTDTNTISKWTKTRFHMTHVTYEFHWVHLKQFMTYGTFNTNRAPIFCSTISKRTKQISTRPSSPRSTAGASKTIYGPMVHLMQTELLSCNDANTVSKQIKTRFHMTHVT
jgi:hypothetical protein